MITKYNYKRFTKKKLLPNVSSKPTSATTTSDRMFKQSLELLEQAKRYYDSLQSFRDNRERNKRYLFGDQLSDLIPNPEGCGEITEKEYMIKRGITPMSFNIIRKAVKAVVGVYCQSNYEPLVISRDRDEQKLGEMMTIAMEYNYQNRNLPEVNTRGFEEFLISALVAYRVGYDIDQERKISDVKVSILDNNRLFFDSNTGGLYFENISTIGYLHDMTIGDVLQQFAHSPQEMKQIQEIYKECQMQHLALANDQFKPDSRRRNIDFYTTLEPEHCRIIELWTKELYASLYCHDTGKGEEFFVEAAEEKSIIAENNRRMLEMVEAGGNVEDAALITYQWKIDNKWTVRYLTPNGYILYQGETPYNHGSHPFVIGAFPLVDGEIHSFIEDSINANRMVNRLMMRIEYQRMNDIKGLIAINKKIRERSDVSLTELAAQITSPNGVIELDWESGEEPLKQYNSSTNTQGDIQMLQQYMTMLDEVTGAHGAMRGERASSGTPAALYAQETENANNNIADILKWYNGLIRKRDYKMMQVIQQYYQDRRYLNIAGKDYTEESKWYDPDKVRNSQFDLALIENQSVGIFRIQNENLLLQLLNMQAIDPQTYLENSNAPFADKLLERMKSREEEIAEQQQQQALIQQTNGLQQTQPIQ